MDPETRKLFIADAVRKLVGGFGWLGVFLILYSVISEVTGHRWQFIETWGPPVSIFLTVLGTMMTAASIYYYDTRPNPPEKFSVFIAAPLVILFCTASLWFLITHGTLPLMLTNGLAILGLAGAFFRLQTNPGILR